MAAPASVLACEIAACLARTGTNAHSSVEGSSTPPVLFPENDGNAETSFQSIGLPPQAPHDAGKLTVVLDLDETLVHAEFFTEKQSRAIIEAGQLQALNLSAKKCGAFCFVFRDRVAFVRKRPFLELFLLTLARGYELIAFTAAEEDYASRILQEIDPCGTIFRHCLYRQHCAMSGRVKDLRVLNRPLERTVLVDNSHTSFFFQLSNGIPINSFTGDLEDQALVVLMDFLNMLSPEVDVRRILNAVFRLETRFAALASHLYL